MILPDSSSTTYDPQFSCWTANHSWVEAHIKNAQSTTDNQTWQELADPPIRKEYERTRQEQMRTGNCCNTISKLTQGASTEPFSLVSSKIPGPTPPKKGPWRPRRPFASWRGRLFGCEAVWLVAQVLERPQASREGRPLRPCASRHFSAASWRVPWRAACKGGVLPQRLHASFCGEGGCKRFMVGPAQIWHVLLLGTLERLASCLQCAPFRNSCKSAPSRPSLRQPAFTLIRAPAMRAGASCSPPHGTRRGGPGILKRSASTDPLSRLV